MGISREQALDCFRSDDLVGIGMEADAVRRRLHPEGVVSYVVGATVDCARPGGAAERATGDAVELGASGVCVVGIADMEMERLETWLRDVRRRFSAIWIEGRTVEIAALAKVCGLGIPETIARLHGAGLDSLAGVGVGDGAADWIAVHRAAHRLGMRTTAEMTFGGGETLGQRVDLLQALRGLQEETGGFAAFAPVAAAAPGGRELDGVTAVERLKTLAVSRMFLDNIENVQASTASEGLKVLQMGLRFGANDAGSVAPEASRRSTAGPASKGRATEEDLRRIIRDAGFRPVERDGVYRAMMLG
jgi:cyclic dehypoxanthinyl futalosine synthase